MALAPTFLLEVAQESLGLRAEEVKLLPGAHDADPTVSAIASALSRELIDGKPGSAVYVRSLAQILALHLLRHYNRVVLTSESQPVMMPSRPVARAMQHIRAHFADVLSLADIAGAAQVSPFHLARLFKQTTGQTPHQYLIQVRVESARALLTAGANRSLAEVAEAVGFADQSHLTRHMKRLLGVTPGGLRDRVTGVGKRSPNAMVRSLKEGAKRALSSAPRLRSPVIAG
jgi:AraC family transcriptional regulator